jgi:membrane-bound ClpP family serine protease
MNRSGARFVGHNDSLAASAGSVILVACDEVIVAPGSMTMIHNAWTLAMGDKNVMLDTASLLEKIDGTIANQYAAKTGMKREDIAALMDAETWLTAEEAVSQGFADSIEEKAVKAKNAWNLRAYAKAPEIAEEPAEIVPEPAENTPEPTENHSEQLRAARERELRLIDTTAA